MTMTLVSTVTVGAGGASSIDFTSIPQTGTDLIIQVSARDTFSYVIGSITPEFNGDTGNKTARQLRGSGSAVYSNSSTALSPYSTGDSATSNTFGNVHFYIPNYTGSTTKSISIDAVSENNATEAYQTIMAGLWNSTAAITSIKLVPSIGFGQYSTASLYTITKGSGGATVS